MSGLKYEQWQVARYDVRTNTATVNDVTLPMPLHGWRPAQDSDIRVMLDHRGNITHFAPTLTGVEALSKSVEEFRQGMATSSEKPKDLQPEYTGGSSSYYRVKVEQPISGGEAYEAECNDIIEALGMTFAEGNIFKAIWRIAAARQGKQKRGHEARYDFEKIEFFAGRELEKLDKKEPQ